MNSIFTIMQRRFWFEKEIAKSLSQHHSVEITVHRTFGIRGRNLASQAAVKL